jgi:acetyl/propionyl-CoA carboxylase alpha subunit
LSINGHSIELRVCAEDPFNDFLPNIGKITTYDVPTGDNIRVDDFVESGYEIPIYYDNMISKLIVWAPSRIEAIEKMKDAIRNYRVEGLATTLPFGDYVMNHPAFISGDFDTQFIKNHYSEQDIQAASEGEAAAAALLAAHLMQNNDVPVMPNGDRNSNWAVNRK